MYCLAAFFFIGALWSTPSVLALDCTDEDALKMEVTKCFTQSGLSVDPDTATDVEPAMMSNASYACRNTEALKSALSCVMVYANKCVRSWGEDPAILPDINKMTDGLLYLCEQLADFDEECFMRTHPAITKCRDLKIDAFVSVSRELSVKSIVCKTVDAEMDCARQKLSVCPGKTREMYHNYLMDNIPTACSGGALWSTPSVLALDCTGGHALGSEMTKCFTQSGLSVDAGTDVLIAMLSNTSYSCRNIEAFESAVSCVTGMVRNCQISMGKDPAIVPDANKVTDGLVYLCDHIADFDAECFIGTLPTINKCVQRKIYAARSVSSDQSLKFVACTFFDAVEDCMRQNLGVCPRRTKAMYLNYFEYAMPPACSGGTSAGGASCVFLLLAALLAVICRY